MGVKTNTRLLFSMFLDKNKLTPTMKKQKDDYFANTMLWEECRRDERGISCQEEQRQDNTQSKE